MPLRYPCRNIAFKHNILLLKSIIR